MRVISLVKGISVESYLSYMHKRMDGQTKLSIEVASRLKHTQGRVKDCFILGAVTIFAREAPENFLTAPPIFAFFLGW